MRFDFEIFPDVIIVMPYNSDMSYSNELEINTEKYIKWIISEDMYKPIKSRGNEWDDVGEAPLYDYAFLLYQIIKEHIEHYLIDNNFKI